MATAAVPKRRGRERSRAPYPRLDRAARIIVALILIGAGLVLAYFNETFRAVEATMATWLLSLLGMDQLPAYGSLYFVSAASEQLVALQVTVECTTLVIALPLTAVAVLLLAFTNVGWARTFLGMAAMWIIVFVFNVARLGLIGWATQAWGVDPGYKVSHVFVGSFVGIFGFVLGLIALLLIIGFLPTRRHKGRAGER